MKLKLSKHSTQKVLIFSGTLLRLVGANNNLTVATAETNAVLRKQNDIKERLAKNKLDFSGDVSSSQDLRKALDQIDERLLELNRKKLTNRESSLINFKGDINSSFDLKEALKNVSNQIDVLSSQNVDTSELEKIREKLRDLVDTPINFDKAERSLTQLKNKIENTISIQDTTRTSIIDKFINEIKTKFDDLNVSLDTKDRY
jgi:hypothetical protein